MIRHWMKLALPLVVGLAACAPTPRTARVSDGADVRSIDASTDGRYVVFSGEDSTIRLRDRLTRTVTPIGRGTGATVSDDGRYVAYRDREGRIVREDRTTGAVVRVDVPAVPGAPSGGSGGSIVSGDGRLVAFSSSRTDLVPGDTNDSVDIFVRDVADGRTERVSVTSAEAQSGFLFCDVCGAGVTDLSPDGRYVVFVSAAVGLVAGDEGEGGDVFVRDRQEGTTTRANLTDDDLPMSAADGFEHAEISADGRLVAFSGQSRAGGQEIDGVFLRDRVAGTTRRATVSAIETERDRYLRIVALSENGRFLAFGSVLEDLSTGAKTSFFVATDGTPANRFLGGNLEVAQDGTVVFTSDATNLFPGDDDDTDAFARVLAR